MTIYVENYQIEIFEIKKDYTIWMDENFKEIDSVYYGKFYDIPSDVRALFEENILVSIRKKSHIDTEWITIHKKQNN